MHSVRGLFGPCRPHPHVSAAASAMLPLLRCVPRSLGSAVAGLRATASSPPLRPLLQPVPRPCIRPFGLLSVRAGSARRPSLLRPREPCACGCSELHTEGECAHVGRGREWYIPGWDGGRGPSRPSGAATRGPEHFPSDWQPEGETHV